MALHLSSSPQLDSKRTANAQLSRGNSGSNNAQRLPQLPTADRPVDSASDDDSDPVDMTRIIDHSARMRNRVINFLHRRDSSDDDNGSDGGGPTELFPLWRPQFLAHAPGPQHQAHIGNAEEPEAQNADGSTSNPTPRHIYPLRRRHEKNLHPYTKLVWIDPSELQAAGNRRRDLSVFQDGTFNGRSSNRSNSQINQEDSEDDDYIPGVSELKSPELGVSQPVLSPELEDIELKSHSPAEYAYGHAFHRRRPRVYSGMRKRRRRSKENATRSHSLTQPSPATTRPAADRLPSVASLLGPRRVDTDGSGSDAGSESSQILPLQDSAPTRSANATPQTDAQNAYLNTALSSMSFMEDRDMESGWEVQLPDNPQPVNSGNEPQSSQAKRRRRQLVRGRHTVPMAETSDDQSPVNELPTAKARMLEQLSRNQIRGILPFSFMRDFDQDKDMEISEEINRWRARGERGPTGARVRRIDSSPNSSAHEDGPSGGLASHGVHQPERNAQKPSIDTNMVADMFSDPPSPDASHSRQTQSQSALSNFRRPRYTFNFMDVFEWQYPPLVIADPADRAPDFLRIAARESRRRGIRAKHHPDDPSKKVISIAPHLDEEFEEGDVAQSILATWRLGTIDIRRVHFMDDMDDTDMGFENNQLADWTGDDWPSAHTSASRLPELDRPLILISDNEEAEAIEDNSVPGLGGSRRNAEGHRPAKSRRTGKRRAAGSPKFRASDWRHGRVAGSLQADRSATRGLGEVMGEFAAISSSGSEVGASDGEQSTATRLFQLPPPLGSLYKSTKDVQRSVSSAQVRNFVGQFNMNSRSRTSGTSSVVRSRHSSANRSRFSSARNRYTGVSGSRTVPGVPSVSRAEFVFDDEPSQGGQMASVQQPRRQQPRILSSSASGGKRTTAGRYSGGVGRLDAVINRISKQQTHRSPIRRAANALGSMAKKSGRHNASRYQVHRKRTPMRINTWESEATTERVAGHPDIHQPSTPSVEDALPAYGPLAFGGMAGSLDLPQPLASGTRFRNDAWITQGGIRRIHTAWQQGFMLSAQMQGVPTNSVAESVSGPSVPVEFRYGDILAVDMSSSAADFVQASETLFTVWYESLEAGSDVVIGSTNDGATADVFRWIDFSQAFLVSLHRSAASLSTIANRMADMVPVCLVKLDSFSSGNSANMTLASAVCLSFLVCLSQLSLMFAGRRNDVGRMGPQAVGDDDELDARWTSDRFRAEIDNCMLVLVRLLSLEAQARSGSVHLGPAKEVWIALIQLFIDPCINSTDSPALALAQSIWAEPSGSCVSAQPPASGVWAAVTRVCSLNAKTDQQLAWNTWSALFYLLPLAQINADGVAAPRTAAFCSRPLVQLLETAVDKQLVGAIKSSSLAEQQQLKPAEEVSARQTFFRVHSIVTTYAVDINVDSSLYVTLYRFLEARKFRSLTIEPPPSLPRFFTRYSGQIVHRSSPSDTCTLLWLKALDVSMASWVAQLAAQAPTSKQYRRTMRDVRSLVSKLLPTRLLTFDRTSSDMHLSTLANYYSVFLFFLHALPSDVVRAARLFTQFQALLKFRETTSIVARRVYFEAWSAAATIVLKSFAQCVEQRSSAVHVVDLLLSGDTSQIQKDTADYYSAIMMAGQGWAKHIDDVLDECTGGLRSQSDTGSLWALADQAVMYLSRVVTSAIITPHVPTLLLFIYAVLQRPAIVRLVTLDTTGDMPIDMHVSIVRRISDIVGVRQQAVLGITLQQSAAPAGSGDAVERHGHPVEPLDLGQDSISGHDDSQLDFDMYDTLDLIAAAEEAEKREQLASFAAIDAKVVQLLDERYIPAVRQQIIGVFSVLGGGYSRALRRNSQELLAHTHLLVRMVSTCVDAGKRTWQSFVDVFGRDSLHLVPDKFGRRLVLTVFAVEMVDHLQGLGRPVHQWVSAVKDIWFSAAADLRLTVHVHRLAAQLRWLDEHQMTDSLAVFVGMPLDRRIIDSNGLLRDDRLGHAMRSAPDYEQRAALATTMVDFALEAVSRCARASAADASLKRVLAGWIGRLVSGLRDVQADETRAVQGTVDLRSLVAAMSQRIMQMVQMYCLDLGLSPDLLGTAATAPV